MTAHDEAKDAIAPLLAAISDDHGPFHEDWADRAIDLVMPFVVRLAIERGALVLVPQHDGLLLYRVEP